MPSDEQQPKSHRSSDKVVRDYERAVEKSARRQRLKSARKGQRRNLEPKPPRRKNWDVASVDEWDELDLDPRERIMPIDELDRRRAIENAAFGGTRASAPHELEAEVAPATVVSVASGLCIVERDGERLQCRIRSGLTAKESAYTNAVAAGDRVVVTDDGAGGGIIEEVLPRRTTLVRPETGGPRSQVIVANAEQVLIVSSWREPFFWPELVDRCIIAAQRSDLVPIVCVNKVDLVDDEAELDKTIAPYLALEHRVIRTSAVATEGIDDLRNVLRDKTTALTGMSGTGKSSLISAVQPGLDVRTSEVSTSTKHLGEGRHTTTMVEMHGLEMGGFVVDTPGIREFGLRGLHRPELAGFFPEISALAPECQFADCAHLEEPGCAVVAGRASGAVPESRYHSYRTILDTLR